MNKVGNPFRCVVCNLFISMEEARIYDFIPDTPFTVEKIEYICETCLKVKEEKEKDE